MGLGQFPAYLCMCLDAQLCLTLFDSLDCSPPGSSVHGISPGKTLEWVAMPSSMDLSNPGIESRSPALQADSLLSEPPRNHIILFLQEAKIGAVLYAHLKTQKQAGKLLERV